MTFSHTATVERLQASGNKNLFVSSGSFDCFLQPIDSTSAQLYGITFTKGSVVYAPIDADVLESDRLTINGVKYGVRGIQSRDYGSLIHKKVIVEQA